MNNGISFFVQEILRIPEEQKLHPKKIVKVCPNCRIEKPLSSFYVYPNGRLHANCKLCDVRTVQFWRNRNKKRLKRGKLIHSV